MIRGDFLRVKLKHPASRPARGLQLPYARPFHGSNNVTQFTAANRFPICKSEMYFSCVSLMNKSIFLIRTATCCNRRMRCTFFMFVLHFVVWRKYRHRRHPKARAQASRRRASFDDVCAFRLACIAMFRSDFAVSLPDSIQPSRIVRMRKNMLICISHSYRVCFNQIEGGAEVKCRCSGGYCCRCCCSHLFYTSVCLRDIHGVLDIPHIQNAVCFDRNIQINYIYRLKWIKIEKKTWRQRQRRWRKIANCAQTTIDKFNSILNNNSVGSRLTPFSMVRARRRAVSQWTVKIDTYVNGILF